MKFGSKSKKSISVVIGLCLLSAWTLFYLWTHTNREPAAIEQQNFFNFFDNKGILSSALEEDIVESIKVAKKQRNFQIEVRNFLVKNTKNNLHLCEYFSHYTLTFEAEGIATSGERPSMTVSTNCTISYKTNLPQPLVIPVEDIFKLKPSDTDISFQANPKTAFTFRNISDSWPEYWVLSKIQFNHKDYSEREILIDRREIYKYSKDPLVMSWE